MAKKSSPKPAASDEPPAPEEGDDGDAMIMVPLDLVTDSLAQQNEDAQPPAPAPADSPGDPPLEDEIVVTAARRQIADEAGALMGAEADADGLSVDVVDAGNELVLWAQSPSPSAVAVVPDIDMSDPEDWLEALADIDLPADIEMQIEKLATQAVSAGADGPARRQFMAELGALLDEAGIETLAVRKDGAAGTFDWIALSPDDVARERDGEPWAPRGDDDGISLRPVGVALGLGGRLSLWPSGPLAAPSAPAPADKPAEG